MKKYLNIIKKSSLFYGIETEEIEVMLKCLLAEVKNFSKGEFILGAGDTVRSVGLILSGTIHVINEDFWGNRNIISEFSPGQVFGESYAATANSVLNMSVLAMTEVVVMFIGINKILNLCSSSCAFHNKLIQNMLSTIADNNVNLNEKLNHITKRTTRQKLLSYLSAQAQKHGSTSFTIPFNRQQLADYLSVERSAMSNELCKLRDEQLLSFNKNNFILLN